MADNERVSKTILRYEVDQSSVQRAVASVDAIDKGFVKARGNLATTSQEIKNLAGEMDTLKRNTALDKLIRDAVTAGKATGDLDYKLTELEIGLRDIGANEKYIAKVTERFKELETQANRAASASASVGEAGNGGGGGSFNLSSLRGVGRAANQLGLGSVGGPLQKIGDVALITDKIEAAVTALAATGASFSALALVAAPVAVLLAGVAIAQQRYNDDLKKGNEFLDAALQAQGKYYDDVEHLTTAKAQQRLLAEEADQSKLEKLRKEDRDAIIRGAEQSGVAKPFIEQFIKTGDSSALRSQDTLKELFKAYDDVNKKLQESGQYSTRLAQGLEAGAFKGNDAVGVIEDIFNKITTGAQKAHDAVEQQVKLDYSASQQFNKTLSDDMDQRRKEAADAAAHEKAFREQQIQEAIRATEKYNNAVKDANEKEGEQELAAKQKYADKVASAIQKAIDDADKALEKLNQTRDNLYLGAQRDDAKASRKDAEDDINRQIKERQQERDDLIGHLKKIHDIQKQFQSGERDALLDRNFLSLFKLQEQKKEQTSAENEAYEETKRQRAQDYQDEVAAAARARAFERNERQIALQERLDDALRGYQHEIQLAAQARSVSIRLAAQQRDAEILLAQQKRNATLSILASQYQQELRLASLTSQARLQIFANELIQARQMGFQLGLSQAISETSPYSSPGTNGINIKRFAEGGTFGPGTIGMYNDGYPGQRESINGVRMPPGIGLFVSSAAGAVTDSGAHIGSLSMPIHIHESHNPRATYRVAKQAVVDGIKQVMHR